MSPRARLLLLVPAALALALGVLGGLARLGVVSGVGLRPVLSHGGLVVAGAFGALIGLERAVALGARPAYLAPLLSGAGALSLLLGAPEPLAWALLLGGALALVAINVAIVKKQPALFTVTMLLGALCLALGDLHALLARSALATAPWIAFLVLTIAGERLELSRMAPAPRWAKGAFAVVAFALLAAAALSFVLPLAALGVPLAALALWLARFDVARRTLRGRGLTRYVAVCLLSGFAWLAAGGALAAFGAPRDAWLHAVLLGFVMTMVFAHAPIILPAVARLPVRYGPWLYLPLAALHLTLLVRVAASVLPASAALRPAGALGNAIALALFAIAMITSVALGARRR